MAIASAAGFHPRPLQTGDTSRGRVVMLGAAEWISRPLPVRPFIVGLDATACGEWTLVFVHHDCPECQRLLADMRATAPAGHVAIVELPPYGSDAVASAIPKGAILGRFDGSREWVMETPVAVVLRDDKVTYVAKGGDLTNGSRVGSHPHAE